MKLIGISGRKYSGKTTVARIITHKSKLLTDVRGFADALKEEVAEFLKERVPDFKSMNIPHIVHCMDKDKNSFRLLYQWWGTEYRRKYFGKDYWIQILNNYIHDLTPTLMIIPDVRFMNEAEWIARNGGVLIRIERECVELISGEHSIPPLTRDTHTSETELTVHNLNWNYIIYNTRGLKELEERTTQIMGHEQLI